MGCECECGLHREVSVGVGHKSVRLQQSFHALAST